MKCFLLLTNRIGRFYFVFSIIFFYFFYKQKPISFIPETHNIFLIQRIIQHTHSTRTVANGYVYCCFIHFMEWKYIIGTSKFSRLQFGSQRNSNGWFIFKLISEANFFRRTHMIRVRKAMEMANPHIAQACSNSKLWLGLQLINSNEIHSLNNSK